MKDEIDLSSLEFHIKSNDYFGTLASVLSLIEQNLCGQKVNKVNSEILTKLVKTLGYLQKEYIIIKK